MFRNVIACLLLSESPTTAYLRMHGSLVETMTSPEELKVGYLAPHVHLSRGQQWYLRSGRLDCKAHPAISRYMHKLDEHRCARPLLLATMSLTRQLPEER